MSNELIIKVEINSTNGYTISNLNLTGNTPNTQIDVDWGDGHAEGFASSISNYAFNSIEHTYSAEDGEYTITITGVTAINNYFLQYMENVVEVTIPNNITSLPDYVFDSCSNLEKVTLPNSISTIGTHFARYTNIGELILPESLTSIGVYFLYGSSLEEVILPYGISEIPNYSFGFMSELTNIKIPNSVTTIGDGVLFNCDNLSYIEIPKSVEIIGEDFLSGCDSNSLILKFQSETPPSMGAYLLSSVQNYTIHVPEGSIMNYINEFGYPSNQSKYVEYPTLKHKLETLGKLIASNLTNQFVTASWDEGLTTLANKVNDIQDFNDIFEFDSSNDYASNGINVMFDAGNQAKSYFTLKIPSTITTLGDESLQYYANMKICEIPSSVTSIGNYVFNFNQSLEKIIFKGTTPPTATSRSFVTNSQYSVQNIPTTCVIEVPCGALSAYKSATNYPDPTVYTYQCIRFDEKCDSSNGLSNFESPILLGFYWHGTSTMNYNSNMNAYALSGYFDDTVFPITQLDGQENFMMSCEINISNFGGEKIGFAIIPPETGEETTSNKYGNIVYIDAPSNNQITLQYMSKKQGGVIQNTNENLTINIENLDWIKLCFMSDTTSSGSIIGQVEKLDGTILGTQTFTRIYSSSNYPQISNRKCGIYFLGNNEDDTVNIYIRNIKCIGY